MVAYRIISFSVLKEKVKSGEKSQSIRRPRKRPFEIGEIVSIWWKQRSPNGHYMFHARIRKIVDFFLWDLTDEEAVRDGFPDRFTAVEWIEKRYRKDKTFKGAMRIIRFERIPELKHQTILEAIECQQ